MKATINVHPKNQYAKLNGHTFEVKDLLHNGVGLLNVNTEFPNNQVDFSFKEIIIVDLEKEYIKSNYNDGVKLLQYASINKLTLREKLPKFIR